MRVALIAALAAGVLNAAFDPAFAPAQPAAKAAAEYSPAAERTRMKLLPVKVTVEAKKVPLRDVLKEFAAQVEMQTERPVMWTYAADVPAGTPVTYTCSEKPLVKALDELFTPLKLGYVIVSEDDRPRDGWVRIIKGNDRGAAVNGGNTTPAGDDDDEKKAATRLGIAKEQLDKGRKATAKAVLNGVIEKYPKTKAAAEAKALLEKLDK